MDAIEQLSPADQEVMLEIVQRRIAERRRQELIATVAESQAELERGELRPATVEEIMAAVRP
ncbi:MAG TPA: hypothetical protein VM165_17680 [Planctomycetaceae bacterium]|nr:hypothetical protein [Planctomycetaceae bacterium]